MTKRLPKVGETWFKRCGDKATVKTTTRQGQQPVQTITESGRYDEHYPSGQWTLSDNSNRHDLVLIHKDATGKVINATFDPALIGKDEEPEPMSALVDPMTVDWPRSAFEVGMEVVVKPGKVRELEEQDGLNCSKPLRLLEDDGSEIPKFHDQFGNDHYEYLRDLVPLHEVEKYQAALAAQKGTMPTPTPKPSPMSSAIEAAKARLQGLEARAAKEAELAKAASNHKALRIEVAKLKVQFPIDGEEKPKAAKPKAEPAKKEAAPHKFKVGDEVEIDPKWFASHVDNVLPMEKKKIVDAKTMVIQNFGDGYAIISFRGENGRQIDYWGVSNEYIKPKAKKAGKKVK